MKMTWYQKLPKYTSKLGFVQYSQWSTQTNHEDIELAVEFRINNQGSSALTDWLICISGIQFCSYIFVLVFLQARL